MFLSLTLQRLREGIISPQSAGLLRNFTYLFLKPEYYNGSVQSKCKMRPCNESTRNLLRIRINEAKIAKNQYDSSECE